MHNTINTNSYKVIGVMSGTSMDGLDLAYCEFEWVNDKWHYTLGPAQTIPYTQTWLTRLNELHKQPMFVLPKTDAFYGKYIGQCITNFIKQYQLHVDYIASHGHTIFHNPAEGYTTQVGSGAAIYAETTIPTICDFRTVDVALGGQGAPLVPIGDELLFSEYDACVNLGGFANISFKQNGKRVAFDICPCNILLNAVAQQIGFKYDENGQLASTGKINTVLLDSLNTISYYQQLGAKSLSREWVEKEIWPLVKPLTITHEDLLATFTEHIALQLSTTFNRVAGTNMLITGGGAFNSFLVNRLRSLTKLEIILPASNLIQFKEALIFAFMGVLKLQHKTTALAEVTNAKHASIGGCIYG